MLSAMLGFNLFATIFESYIPSPAFFPVHVNFIQSVSFVNESQFGLKCQTEKAYPNTSGAMSPHMNQLDPAFFILGPSLCAPFKGGAEGGNMRTSLLSGGSPVVECSLQRGTPGAFTICF